MGGAQVDARAGFRFSILLLLQTVLLPSAAAALCLGDCDGNDVVALNEVVLAVDIALGATDPSACPVFGQAVSVDELVGAVASAMNGCEQQPEATDTPSTPVATGVVVATDTPAVLRAAAWWKKLGLHDLAQRRAGR
jgi:hypothetical protein